MQAFPVSACWFRKPAKHLVCGVPHGFHGPNSDIGCFQQNQPVERSALWQAWADGNGPSKDFLWAPEKAAAEKTQHSCVFPVWGGMHWKHRKIRPSCSEQTGREPVFHLCSPQTKGLSFDGRVSDRQSMFITVRLWKAQSWSALKTDSLNPL